MMMMIIGSVSWVRLNGQYTTDRL